MDPIQKLIADMKNATKVVERKNAVHNLETYLMQNSDDICHSLDVNSVTEKKSAIGKLTWSRLFDEVHEFFNKETEKKIPTGQNKSACFSIVNKVFKQATMNRPWLQWQKVHRFIIGGLSNDRLAVAYGRSFVDMLENFLAVDLYREVQDASAWADTLNILVRCHGKYNITSCSILKCLVVCITHGSLFSEVIPTLRSRIVTFYHDLIYTNPDVIHQDTLPFLEGITALCVGNACEFRRILCKLGEEIIQTLVSPHSHSSFLKEQAALVKFLLVQYALHMPSDVDISSEAFYAADIPKWKETLRLVYSFCIDAIEETASKRSQRTKCDANFPDQILILAAKCAKQISSSRFNESDSSEDGDELGGRSPKRKMKYKTFATIISDVSTKSVTEGLFVWVRFFSVVLDNFPEMIQTKMQFSNLVHLGNILLKNVKNCTRTEFYSYFLSLLNAEQCLRRKGLLNEVSDVWSTVWNAVIKSIESIPLSKDRSSACILLRRLMKEIRPSDIRSLLNLYLTNSLSMEKCTLELLAELLSLCTVPVEMKTLSQSEEMTMTTSSRMALIKWLVKASNEVIGSEALVGVLMCSLLVKQSHLLILKEIDLNLESESPTDLEYDSESNGQFGFERILLKTCFVKKEETLPESGSGSAISATFTSDIDCPHFRFIVVDNLANRLVQILKSNFDALKIPAPRSAEFETQYRKYMSQVILCLNLINILTKYSINMNTPGMEMDLHRSRICVTLQEIFSSGMEHCNSTISLCFHPINGLRKHPKRMLNFIDLTRMLFTNNTNLCENVKVMLNRGFTMDSVTQFKKVFRSNLARQLDRVLNNSPDVSSVNENLVIMDDELPNRLRKISLPNAAELDIIVRVDRSYEAMSLAALRLLTDYGLICGNKGLFDEILKDLLEENFCSTNQFLLEACYEVILRVVKILQDPGLPDLQPHIIGVLQKACRGFYVLPKCAAKIWELFKEVIPIIAPVENESRKNFSILIGTSYAFLTKGNIRPVPYYVFDKAFKALMELAKNDVSTSWSVVKASNIPQPLCILEDIGFFISSKSHLIRLWTVETICTVYENAAPFDYTGGVVSSSQDGGGEVGDDYDYQRKRQDFLKTLYSQLMNIYEVDVGLSADEAYEEGVNRVSTVISCLTRIIFAFPYTTKMMVIFLFLIVKLKNICVQLTNRALEYASPNAMKTICSHFPYVLQKTLSLEEALEDLPYQLFGCDSQHSFFLKFQKEISAELFQRNDRDQLDLVSGTLDISVKELMQRSYDLIMARVTPYLSMQRSMNPQNSSKCDKYKKIHQNLIEVLGGKEVSDTLLASSMGDVILNLITLIFDPNITHTWRVPDIHVTEPVPPHHSEEVIENSLKYLQSISPYSNQSVIGHLAQTSHESIYKILLCLRIRVHESHDSLEEYWRLHHFSFFVKLLMKEPPEIFATMKEYVCNFVFSTYLRLLNNPKDEGTSKKEELLRFRKVILFLIFEVVMKITEDYTEEMIIFFDPVIRGIVSAVGKCPGLIPFAKEILEYLLVTHGQTFSHLIENLDPFPVSIEEFHEYSLILHQKKYNIGGGSRTEAWSLAKEFDALIHQPSQQCTKERLHFLRDLLVSRKKDLDRMVRHLESKRFSEECLSDPLHNIIQMLIGITLSPAANQDEELLYEACRCLGEIGPVDLSVLVLPPYKRQGKIQDESHALLEIIKIIAGFLSSDDVNLVSSAGNVLRSLLKFKECSGTLKRNDQGLLQDRTERLYNSLNPFHSPYPSERRQSIDKIDSNVLENKLSLNELNEQIDYRTWVTKLTIGLIECFKDGTSLVSYLIPLCEMRVDFCENIFPYVVYLTLYSGRTNIYVKRTLGGYFRTFFTQFVTNSTQNVEQVRSSTPSSFGVTKTSIYLNKMALRTLINAVQFLRRHPVPQELKGKVKPTAWDSNYWMDLNYLDISRAAQYCGAYLSSIMYIEIHATEIERSWGSGASQCSRDSDGGASKDDDGKDEFYSQGVSVKNRKEATNIEKLLLKAYSSIGENDAAYGCGSARFSDNQSSMHHMEQSEQWHRLLIKANGSYVDPDSCQYSQVALSMKHLGVYNILWDFLKVAESRGNGTMPDELAQVQYECGWRLTKWDLGTENPSYIRNLLVEPKTKTKSAFQMSIYDSINAGLIQDKPGHVKAVKSGMRSVHNDLKHASLESSENIYGFLSKFQMLRVVEDFFENMVPDQNLSQGLIDIDKFVKKWKIQDRVPTGGFKYHEPTLFLRNVLLTEYDKRKPVNLAAEINDSSLDLISRAREAGRLDYAESCATAMASLHREAHIPREFEVAKNNWARGNSERDVAMDIMSKLIRKCPQSEELYPSLLLLYGDWLSISQCERPTTIIERYLQKSCNFYESKGLDPSKAYITLAKYADAEYQNVTKYMASDMFVAKVSFLEKARKEEESMRLSLDENTKKSVYVSKKHSNYDQEEITIIKREQQTFLELALKHYLRGLKTSSDNDLLIFRAISLWLENNEEGVEFARRDKMTQIFGEETMPSYKYLMVLHQLSARLSKEDSSRNKLLAKILATCALEHPFHTLPVLLTQANLHKDEKLPAQSSSLKVQLAGRVEAAADIVGHLKKNAKLSKILSKMEVLWLALIKLANIEDRASNASGIDKNIPAGILSQLKDMSLISVPTCSVPVLQSSNYKDNVIYIHSFESKYGLVGGINSPKKIKCRGSNGVLYNMLLKGQDDLRQDAVMQQVFGVMNRLLLVEPKTRMRRLHIRTYKVIPLSQRTGLIEWVENTQTLGEYLTGTSHTNGAHVRYRPSDYKPIECRKILNDAKQKDIDQKYTTYENICENFKPVFRHFFFENFKEAGVFFEKRLAYTRSVATNSIIGYFLGLGDRHVLNILLDKTTAEFIHIDLGVAFEQGRILPTPETIPFRLTRDVVDGMGVSGVEGVFRRSCEMTMEVLRNHSEIIMTVLQVLLYDPLYMWALTNDRVAKVQPSDSSKNRKKTETVEQGEDFAKERNNSALRVLLRLRQKLQGIEEEGGAAGAISSGRSLSINGHVALLIQRAIDPKKLCRLFAGWQPYL